jgi:hypothetical protein
MGVGRGSITREQPMKKIVKTGLVASALGATLALGVFIGQATADQPFMHSALDHLQQARSDLAGASWNHGGYRVRALRAVDNAIAAVRQGIRYERFDH